jgi:hypothetical protein
VSRIPAGFTGPLAAAVVLGLTGCGGASRRDTAAVRATAQQFLTAIWTGDGQRACGLETPASAASLAATDALEARYASDGGPTCASGWASLASAYKLVPRAVPGPASIKISGARASFRLPAKPALGLPTTLTKVRGRWLISDPQGSSVAETKRLLDANPSCVAAWNRAVAAGSIAPPDVSGLAAQKVWASLLYGGAPGRCGMYLQLPTARTQYNFDTPPIGPPAGDHRPLSPGVYSRNVWLAANGIATPASDAAPDGSLPGLGASRAAGPARTGSAQAPQAAPVPLPRPIRRPTPPYAFVLNGLPTDIVPQSGVGGMTLPSPLRPSQLLRHFGPPGPNQGHLKTIIMQQGQITSIIYYAPQGIQDVAFNFSGPLRGNRLEAIDITSPAYHTRQGIRVGSTLAAVRAAFPHARCDKLGCSISGPGGDNGITSFDMFHGRVYQIGLID